MINCLLFVRVLLKKFINAKGRKQRMKSKLMLKTCALLSATTLLLSGCGSTIVVNITGSDDYNNAIAMEKVSGPDSGIATKAEKMEAPSTEGWDSSKKIYAYCWDADFANKMNVVLDKYPQYKDYVEIIVTGQGGTTYEYKTTIDTAFSNGNKYPSIIAADNDVAKLWSEEPSKTVPLASIGITDEMYANAYNFSKQYGLYSGQLTCMTWQACPGTFIYRTDIAEEVFGTSDPDDIQEILDDWVKFFDAAEVLKEHGYYMISGYDDIKNAIYDSQTSSFVETVDGLETLKLDSCVDTYLNKAKYLYDNEYVDKTSEMWSSSWAANMTKDGKVFGYFGSPWFFGSMQDMGAEEGKWNCCVGPQAYHWGGTYVMAGKESNNKELQAFLIYSLCCDADIAYDIAVKYGDCVNNKEANERLIKEGVGGSPILNNQNPVETLVEAACKLDMTHVTYADSAIKSYVDEAAKGYVNGSFSKDAAMNYIRQQAKIELGLIIK